MHSVPSGFMSIPRHTFSNNSQLIRLHLSRTDFGYTSYITNPNASARTVKTVASTLLVLILRETSREISRESLWEFEHYFQFE